MHAVDEGSHMHPIPYMALWRTRSAHYIAAAAAAAAVPLCPVHLLPNRSCAAFRISAPTPLLIFSIGLAWAACRMKAAS